MQAQELSDPLDPDVLFETIFGTPPTSQTAALPWRLDGQLQEPIVINFTPGQEQSVEISATVLQRSLIPIVEETLAAQLTAALGDAPTIAIGTLQSLGIDARFDSRALILDINLDPSQRLPVRVDDVPAGTILAAPVSGYLNLRAAQNWGEARQPLQLDSEAVLNVQGWVLESNLALRAGLWQQGDTRLVRDFPAAGLRAVAGDLAVPILGYQTALPQVGVTVARNFSLQPYRTTRPVTNFEFFLQEPAEVDVLVNDVVAQTLQLEAGPQDIRDLPLTAGVNDVELVITDAVGRIERLRFPATLGGDLLAPGLQQFAYSVGVPETTAQLTLTGSHRWGVTPQLTLGAYLQADPTAQLVGTVGSWNAPIGSLSWDLALSHNEGDLDWATRGRYSFIRGDRNLSLDAEYRSEQFQSTSTQTTTTTTTPPFRVGLNYSQRLSEQWRGSLALNYRFGSQDRDTYQVVLAADRSFTSRTRLNIRLSQQQTSGGESEFQARFSVNLFQNRRSISATTTVAAQPEFRFNLSRSPRVTIGGLSRSLTIGRTGDRRTFEANLRQTNFRYEASLRHTYRNDGSQQQQLTFGTAFAFVGNSWGWSRPIRDSFVLVQRHPSWRAIPVEVNPGFNGPIAIADRWGAAILPSLTPYRFSQVRLDAPTAPLGRNLGADRLTVLPTYRSGSLIVVGTAASITARGIILAPNGEPLSLQAGEVRPLDQPEQAPIPFFTNRTGRFAIDELSPGRYEMRFFNLSHTALGLEFSDQDEGLIDLGTLRLMP